MTVQGIASNEVARYTAMKNTAAVTENKEAKEKEQEAAAETGKAAKTDGFVKSEGNTNVTYKKPSNKLSSEQVNQLLAENERRMNGFKQMIQSMVAKQGQKGNLQMFGLNLNVTAQDSLNAAKSIEEGGEWSVDAVATRIMDMAKALSGGDASKISTLRNAVEKGFKAAGVDLGGKLPDISNRTHEEVMKRFDDWEKEASQNGKIIDD